jgi:hypothetical protein
MQRIEPSSHYKCNACGEIQPADMFTKNARTYRGITPKCKPCKSKRSLLYQRNNKAQYAKSSKEYNLRLKALVYEAYGNACACCGETEEVFLGVDHIAGDGAEHRKTVKPGVALYRVIRNENFPKDKYQLLCRNCNWSKGPGADGKCIHQKKVEEMLYLQAKAGK